MRPRCDDRVNIFEPRAESRRPYARLRDGASCIVRAMDRDQPASDRRRIADYLRSTADLTEYFRACRESGDLALVESALADMPEWATFHEVRSALGAAGLKLTVVTGNQYGATVERRRRVRTH